MRELNTAIAWRVETNQSHLEVAYWHSENFEYQRIVHRTESGQAVYLYAKSRAEPDSIFALGAFDTPAQADFFTALHRDNPLFVPALSCTLMWQDLASSTPVYEGVYRVGMKSYRVQQLPDSIWRVDYLEGYRAELLGEVDNAIDACLLVYNHFDGRLRGCKLC